MSPWPVLLTLLSVLVLPAGHVSACERAPGVAAWLHPDDLFEAAAAVFAARVVRVEPADMTVEGRRVPVALGGIRLLDTFKGVPPLDALVRSPVLPGCVPDLAVGRDYLFYVGEGAEGLVLWHGMAASRLLPRPDGSP